MSNTESKSEKCRATILKKFGIKQHCPRTMAQLKQHRTDKQNCPRTVCRFTINILEYSLHISKCIPNQFLRQFLTHS